MITHFYTTSLKIGDLRSLIRNTVLGVVKATSNEETVMAAGGSGSTGTNCNKLVEVAGQT